jgi:hypothetical protein
MAVAVVRASLVSSVMAGSCGSVPAARRLPRESGALWR